MEIRELGGTGVAVPVVGMGTWRTFDVSDAEAEAHRGRVVEAALEVGANLFDSSPMYGQAERVLAAALEGRRRGAIVATKVWSESFSAGCRQIEQALRWFGRQVEIYQIHNLVGWRRYLPLLEELRRDGSIRVIGATHHIHASFPELLRVMETGRVQQIQIPYNVRDRVVEQRILPAAADLGLGVLVMRPFAEGALARLSPPGDRLAPLRQFGIETWPQALLKWILSDRRVHCAIPATTSEAHLRDNAAAGDPPWLDGEARAYVARLAAA